MVKQGKIAALLKYNNELNLVTYTRGEEGFDIVERVG